MYNILIVDDESLICESMKIKISAAGVEDTGQILVAYSGEEALKLLMQKDIQIVFTDIKLGNMSGIDLIKAAEKERIQSKFIVLSGYDDYSLVREAFRLGAMDYLLKPASVEDIKEKLLVAIHTILEEEQIKDNSQLVNNLMVQNDLKKYLLDPSAKMRIVQDANLPYPLAELVMIAGSNTKGYIGQRESLANLWNQLVELLQKENNILVYSFWISTQSYIIIFNYENRDFEEIITASIEAFLVQLKELCFEDAGRLWAALSICRDSKTELTELYLKVQEAYRYRVLYPAYSLIKLMQNKRTGDLVANEEKQWTNDRMDEEAISLLNKHILDNFTKTRLKEYRIDCIKQLYDYYLDQINYLRNKLFHNYVRSCENFEDFDSITSMKTYLLQELYNIRQDYNKSLQREKTISEIAKKYIKENLAKKIDMAVVANMVSMNYTYFSELFKSETGISFRSYIIKLRMEEAKKLLKDPTMKVNDIAVRLGYDNSKNFARAFHNYMGVSPSAYRETL